MIRDGQFRKAGGSGDHGCVEVAADHQGVRVRDSKRPDEHMLAVCDPQWSQFIAGIKSGDFDLPQ
jgi:hypothetical protein